MAKRWLALILVLMPALSLPQGPSASIEGIAVDRVTSQGIAGQAHDRPARRVEHHHLDGHQGTSTRRFGFWTKATMVISNPADNSIGRSIG